MIFQETLFLDLLLFPPIILITPSIVLFIIFLRNFIKTRQRMFSYLTLLFITYLIKHFFQVGHFLKEFEETAELNFVLFQVFEMLISYILIFILEMFETDIYFSKRQMLLTILAFLTIGGMLINPGLVSYPLENRTIVSFPISIIIMQIIFNTVAGIWLIFMLDRSRKSAQSYKQKKLIKWLFAGLLFAVILPSFPIIFREQSESIPPIFSTGMVLLQNIFQNIGMLIIGIAFLRVSKSPWLLQRQKIHLLVVYAHGGVSLYSKVFSKELAFDDTLLLSGGFSAVTSMFEEVTKTPGKVKAILLEGKELRIINKETFLSALLVEYTTQASELAHEKFTEEFEKRFIYELNNFAGDVSIFKPAEEIAKQYFS